MAEGNKLADLQKRLETETAKLMAATDREQMARQEVTQATNACNRLQRAIDDELQKLREGAPCGTDWHGEQHSHFKEC